MKKHASISILILSIILLTIYKAHLQDSKIIKPTKIVGYKKIQSDSYPSIYESQHLKSENISFLNEYFCLKDSIRISIDTASELSSWHHHIIISKTDGKIVARKKGNMFNYLSQNCDSLLVFQFSMISPKDSLFYSVDSVQNIINICEFDVCRYNSRLLNLKELITPFEFIHPPLCQIINCSNNYFDYNIPLTLSNKLFGEVCEMNRTIFPTVSLDSIDNNRIYTQNWQAVDECLNWIEHKRTVTVYPPSPPEFINPPPDITIDCKTVNDLVHQSLLAHNFEFDDYCEISAVIEPTIINNVMDCHGNITVTWHYMDSFGRVLTYQQVITVMMTTTQDNIDAQSEVINISRSGSFLTLKIIDHSEDFDLSIFNIMGQNISDQKIQKNEVVYIETSNIIPGIYILNFKIKGKIINKKIMLP